MALPSDASKFFPSSYADSRARFLGSCDAHGMERDEFLHPLAGPDGQALAMDVAWCGAGVSKANGLLILSSGLHGLEGPLGAACQFAAMDDGRLHQLATSNGWAVLIVHALNPFGFAAHRRWDEKNIDVNRNFWLESDDLKAASATCQELNPWLNPKHRAWNDLPWFYIMALRLIRRHGFSDVKQAIAEGQFQFPEGLFYGGHERSWTRQILEKQLPRWIEGFPLVAHVDVHSGLGSWMKCKLLMDYPVSPSQESFMRQRHAPGSWEHATAQGTAYQAIGGLGRWCNTMFSQQEYLYLCAEVGTYPPIRVLRSLRAENQQWQHEGQRTPAVIEHVREMFCPRSRKWRDGAVDAVWRAIVATVASP